MESAHCSFFLPSFFFNIQLSSILFLSKWIWICGVVVFFFLVVSPIVLGPTSGLKAVDLARIRHDDMKLTCK